MFLNFLLPIACAMHNHSLFIGKKGNNYYTAYIGFRDVPKDNECCVISLTELDNTYDVDDVVILKNNKILPSPHLQWYFSLLRKEELKDLEKELSEFIPVTQEEELKENAFIDSKVFLKVDFSINSGKGYFISNLFSKDKRHVMDIFTTEKYFFTDGSQMYNSMFQYEARMQEKIVKIPTFHEQHLIVFDEINTIRNNCPFTKIFRNSIVDFDDPYNIYDSDVSVYGDTESCEGEILYIQKKDLSLQENNIEIPLAESSVEEKPSFSKQCSKEEIIPSSNDIELSFEENDLYKLCKSYIKVYETVDRLKNVVEIADVDENAVEIADVDENAVEIADVDRNAVEIADVDKNAVEITSVDEIADVNKNVAEIEVDQVELIRPDAEDELIFNKLKSLGCELNEYFASKDEVKKDFRSIELGGVSILKSHELSLKKEEQDIHNSILDLNEPVKGPKEGEESAQSSSKVFETSNKRERKKEDIEGLGQKRTSDSESTHESEHLIQGTTSVVNETGEEASLNSKEADELRRQLQDLLQKGCKDSNAGVSEESDITDVEEKETSKAIAEDKSLTTEGSEAENEIVSISQETGEVLIFQNNVLDTSETNSILRVDPFFDEERSRVCELCKKKFEN